MLYDSLMTANTNSSWEWKVWRQVSHIPKLFLVQLVSKEGCFLNLFHQGYNLNHYDFDCKAYKIVNQDTISQQLLKFNGFLDDPIIEPILIADIDGDGLKDLYASVASKYSYSLTVLF